MLVAQSSQMSKVTNSVAMARRADIQKAHGMIGSDSRIMSYLRQDQFDNWDFVLYNISPDPKKGCPFHHDWGYDRILQGQRGTC